MNTNTVNPEAWLHAGSSFRAQPRRAALRRPVRDGVVAGVAAGLACYLGVDVRIIRVVFVVLAIVGGAGIPLYLAGLLLIPEDGSDSPSPVLSSGPAIPVAATTVRADEGAAPQSSNRALRNALRPGRAKGQADG